MKKLLSACVAALIAAAVCFGGAALGDTAVLSASLRCIPEEAFDGDTSLTEITIPESVTSIGAHAFRGCTSLRTVYFLPNDVPLDDGMFEGAPLTTVYCMLDSTMELYARERELTVKYLDGFEIECDTALNAAPGLPITWKAVNAMPGRTVTSTFRCEVYKEGTAEPVAVTEASQKKTFSFTPATAGRYHADITMTNSLTESTLSSEVIVVPDALYMGVFEQDGNSATEDPVAWTVLAVDGNKALVISSKIIKNGSYFNPSWIKYKYTYWKCSYIGKASSINYRGSGPESAATRITGITPTHIPLRNGTWGKESDLYPLHARYWCNDVFYKTAFTDEERSRIKITHNTNEDSSFGVDGGPDTDDYVFFLSLSQLQKYMPDKHSRNAVQVAAARMKNNEGNYWWLRTPGKFRVNAAYVIGTTGNVSTSGSDVGHNCVGYRPCMWITFGG